MSDLIRLRLTVDQAGQLAPLALQAGRRRENAIFFAVTVPFWSPQEGSTVWDLQVVTISAKLGEKVKKLVSGSTPERN